MQKLFFFTFFFDSPIIFCCCTEIQTLDNPQLDSKKRPSIVKPGGTIIGVAGNGSPGSGTLPLTSVLAFQNASQLSPNASSPVQTAILIDTPDNDAQSSSQARSLTVRTVQTADAVSPAAIKPEITSLGLLLPPTIVRTAATPQGSPPSSAADTVPSSPFAANLERLINTSLAGSCSSVSELDTPVNRSMVSAFLAPSLPLNACQLSLVIPALLASALV